MLRLVPVMQHAVQHIKTPATALSSVLSSGPCRPAASCVQAGPQAYAVTAATWQGISNRFPVSFVPAAAYSSGAGSSDAVPPSNLPSECRHKPPGTTSQVAAHALLDSVLHY